ncbi:MAG: glycosyltransferase family 39 protein [Elusimicrobia bacterium]|nr:glycosyltransferase family 39 protein [Elusimicrobiota bacterium]
MSRREWLALAAVLLLGLGLRAPIAGIFLERDEGEYAYIAQRWLRGEVPYRDSFDQKPPGVFLAYAGIERFSSGSPAAIHWGAQLYTLLTLCVVFLIGRRLFGWEVGCAAGALAAFMTVDHGLLGNSANCELFMLLPLAAAFLAALLAAERGSWRWAMASGACAGASLLFKQVAATDAVFYLAFLLCAPGVSRKARAAAAFAAGAAAVWVPVLVYFAAHGAWAQFFDCVVGYNLSYAGGIPLSDYLRNFWGTFSRTLPGLLPVYLLALAGCVWQAGPASPWIMGWVACSFLGACVGGYFRAHYYLQCVPALAVLAGSGLCGLPQGWRPPRWAAAAAAAAAVLFGVLSSPWYYGPGSAVAKCRRLYQDNPFPEATGVAHVIAERTTEQDRVFVFGSEPEILYYAGRRSATRYIFVYPLLTAAPDAAARQKEAMDEVRAARPKTIVTVFGRKSFLPSSASPMGIFGEVKSLLKGYHILAVVLSNPRNPTELFVDQAARDLWQKFPMWYDRPFWGTLAVWERDG